MSEKSVDVVAENTTLTSGCEASLSLSNNAFIMQSTDVMDSPDIQHETVTFVDDTTLMSDIGTQVNDIISAGTSGSTDLHAFLSRPTRIAVQNWTTASPVGILTQIEPWYEFLNNATIKRKLENFAFLRGTLCLKFVLNATPFHFGMLRIGYEPNVNLIGTGPRNSRIRTNLTTDYVLLTPYSQLPGVDILPAANAGAELKLPYFQPDSWLDITSAQKARNMGLLTVFNGVRLDVASSTATSSIPLEIYAWMEDVQLSASTSVLALQSEDEYDGPISMPASALARFSAQLESIPIIGRYARATTIASSALAQVSKIFGFTNVPLIRDIPPMTPMPFSHLSSSEISSAVQKLTLDPKQELSIDPSLVGLGNQDEMSLKYILEKPTILHVFDWITSQSSGAVLANFRVSPLMFESVNVNNGATLVARRVYHTWLSYFALMFQHWRGDIIFEFEVVCTKFHKGRLQISWDPRVTTGVAALPPNQVYTTILDIGQSNKAEIRVPYHAAREWLKTRGILEMNWSVNSANVPNPDLDNGMLIVSVLTPLVSPISPQEVHIITRVRAADNLEFANPREALGEGNSTPPPSFFNVQAEDVPDTVQLTPTTIVLGDAGSKHKNRYDLNMGERIVSLRALLRRYSLYDCTIPTTGSSGTNVQFFKSFTKLPACYGYDPNGLSFASSVLGGGAKNFNFRPTHPITYVANCYGGFRGGVNFVVNANSNFGDTLGDTMVARMTDETYTAEREGDVQTLLFATSLNQKRRWYNTGRPYNTAGSTFTSEYTNTALSFYYPMMTGVNFQFTDPWFSNVGNSTDTSNSECVRMTSSVIHAADANSIRRAFFRTHAAIGADYTLNWLLCCPTVDYMDSVPLAA